MLSRGQMSVRTIVDIQSRNFARVPLIKFLGPRSKTNKSIGMYASAPGHGSPAASSTQASGPSGNAKPLSGPAEVEYADIIADRWERLGIEEVDVEAFNVGGREITTDWRNIKL